MPIHQRTLPLFAILALLALCAEGKVYQSFGEFTASSTSNYDYILVGGGIGGSVLANRLTEDGKARVLLIGSGVLSDTEGVLNIIVPGLFGQIDASKFNWNYQTTPQAGLNNRTLTYSRGKGLGGSTAVNAMIYTRGSKDDYDLWGKVSGNPKRWSWDALYPWMIKNERWGPPTSNRNTSGQYDPRFHGYAGKTGTSLPWGGPSDLDGRSLKAAEELRAHGYWLNLEPNDGNSIGLTWAQWTIGNGERSSAAAAYLGADVRARKNLDIVLGAYATRVLPVGNLARKPLDFRTVELGYLPGVSNQTLRLTAKKEVILTAGTIGTPHILLNSGIGDRIGLAQVGVPLWHDLPNVGKGVSDHRLAEWQASRTGPLAEFGPSHQFLFKRFEKGLSLFEDYSDPSTGPTTPHAEVVILPSGANVNARIIALTPRSRGSIKIRSSNPFDPPLVDTGFYTDPFDILAMTEAIRTTKRFFSASPFTSPNSTSNGPYITGFLGPDPDLLVKEEFESRIRNISAPYWHMVGSAAMGKSAGESVVDADLRVWGVKGLRVVDASVIPYVPTAHTQAAVYALAERAADFIRKTW
ncbi:alcohol oxidase [Coprinellus micaceus]|uniref:pyranose dehydrogenase (acceptor) n=1 Tax=Coprinellus micaceus TaxID=71717 RepID=A0A4Y7TCG9_COPMI|nr:alcohol oxidase [Coprinellus micaceus]